ncbi:MAG: ABC transporter permease [Chloroflexi bacterium]|jgi:ABC-type polysaccharide/polyol phosphate export permease|nr:ABC transporter permease [Chloroflexota bacterium]
MTTLTTVAAMLRRRETWAALAVLAGLPTLFLFFNLTLAADPSAHLDRVDLGAVVLDEGVATPQGQVSVGPKVVGMLHERLGVAIVPFASEDALRDAVLARQVAGGLVVPEGATASLQAGQPASLTIVRSDAGDAFTNALTTNLVASLGPTLEAALPAAHAGEQPRALVTVVPANVAPAADFRYPALPGLLVLPFWVAGIGAVVLLARAGDAVRERSDAVRTGFAEVALALAGAGIAAAVLTLDIAAFTWRWEIDAVGLFGFLWLATTASVWIILGLVRAFGRALGAALAALALFVQQAVSGASYPSAFAPDVVAWTVPYLPAPHLVEGLRNLLIGGTTTADAAVALAWLAVAGIVLIIIGMGRLVHAALRSAAPRAALPAA